MNTTTTLPGMTIDLTNLRSVFSADGLPQWAGMVVLTLVDAVGDKTTVVTANWAGREESTEGALVDFEGDADEHDPIYEACEAYAADWSAAISKELSRPSHWDAHQNDIKTRKASGLPPFFMGN
jgi:hypothetical protein